jgi:UDP-glucose 4-epimerase
MVDLLVAEGFSVRVIDNLTGGRAANLEQHCRNRDVVLDERDVRDFTPQDCLFRDVKYVFHFAGIGDIVPSIERPVDYMSINVMGTINMLECARNTQIEKFVYAASSSCYGLARTPTDENHLIDPKYPYALSKFQGEQAALHWHHIYRLPVTSIRIFNAYGTRSRTSGAYGAVFGVFLKQKLTGSPLTVVGDGSQKRDFLHVTDVVRAFYNAAAKGRAGQFYNLGAGKPQSVNRLVELLGGQRISIPMRPGEPDCTWANITKITQELEWKPQVSFEDGVAEILNNINYWKDAPLWDPNSIADATSNWFKFMDHGVQ